jgi:hypothetical protein
VIDVIRTHRSTGDLGLHHWVALLAGAETIGMIAAATAARTGQALVPDPTGPGQVAAAIALATAGGVVEGGAVGLVTARLLRPRVTGLPVRRWIAVTTAEAGLGWAAGTVPSAVIGSGAEQAGQAGSSSAGPAVGLVVAGGLGLGIALGALLGWAQSTLLRHRVSHPFRWIGASTLAWAPAMAVIFLGASTPAADWPVPAVIGLAALTGALAGAVLGLVLGWSAPSLTGTSAVGRIIVALLGSGHRFGVPRGLIGLRVRGNRTGTWHSFPVMAARDGTTFVVLPGNPDRKRWWRNVVRPSAVEICRSGVWEPAEAWVLTADDLTYPAALAAYRRRYPRVEVPSRAPLVRIVCRPGAASTVWAPAEGARNE